ncbi:MAG: LPS export ABC transporter periplasmic protein LptC [Myxococcales bacterium]|nr:LPS export ABC transporter periplasmic protein LptC [Myxococcales bacterium]
MPPIARLIGMATGLALFAAPSCPADPELRLTDMTFVGSRDGLREVVVESRFARFLPEPGKAWLEDVAAEVSVANAGMSFTLYCREAEFDVDEIDFLARGDVHGETGSGQRYSTEWVRYEHAEGLLYTEAPVRMVDETGSFRGDGFRYLVSERRFRLLGNVRVEQLQ